MSVTSARIREDLIAALELDLIGPRPDDIVHEKEEIDKRPSSWYLSGFLVPFEAKLSDRSDPTADDEFNAATEGKGEDDKVPEGNSARKVMFPSSMGLSFLLDAGTTELETTVTWGDYFQKEVPPGQPEEATDGEAKKADSIWCRKPYQETFTLPIGTGGKQAPVEVPNSFGLQIVITVSPVSAIGHLPPGTRTVSVFLVNQRRPELEAKNQDSTYAFQTALEIRSSNPFVPRPDPRGRSTQDPDERIADLQYRDSYEFAVGHNVSVWDWREGDRCCTIGTTWIPRAAVEKVVPAKAAALGLTDDALDMDSLGQVPDIDTLRACLGNLPTEYRKWIDKQRQSIAGLPSERTEVANALLDKAEAVCDRIRDGLESLADPQALDAFRTMNRAIATAIRQRSGHDKPEIPQDLKPTWRPFQLAFILTNLRGMVDPSHGDREIVDLLFFPTGGGKTEAYLGLAAFTLVLRRLRDPSITSAGLSVLMRYTLRLLTLDQLGRAATLICALELERQQAPEKMGQWPFEIGLWVGMSATPNRLGEKGDNRDSTARAKLRKGENPIPIEKCPWCGEPFSKNSFTLYPNDDKPTRLNIGCVPDRNQLRKENRQPKPCKFRRQHLPVLAIDETIYRRLPCFIISTVDKFANLPWVGETAGLFGKVTHHQPDIGFCSTADPKATGSPLDKGLLPPDLIIQDELHLISGPLGTMVGLYETAIESLSTRTNAAGKDIKPKIVASTATVRRAESQIKALFGRRNVDIFPPPGPNRRDSFFAVTASVKEENPRLYLGVAAQGRSLKVVLLRTYLALLGAAQKAWNENKKSAPNPADPYMTLLGYFNSLRELGGSRRIVEDEVKSRIEKYGDRKRLGESEGSFANRKISDAPVELTSRVSTQDVAGYKDRLALSFGNSDRVDVALATNMISVGLDINRLGLMVVLGQPKAAAEYIQSTSRVGRDSKRPGLVVTLLNVHRPRDRSHYEHFTVWHEAFYRAVEATSVTPFSPRAIDRGLAAVTVALARLGNPNLTPAEAAADIVTYRAEVEGVADILGSRAEGQEDGREAAATLRRELRDLTLNLLDEWQKEAEFRQGKLQYQQYEAKGPNPLLRDPLETENVGNERFKAQRSLRDVEPTVNLWLKKPDNE